MFRTLRMRESADARRQRRGNRPGEPVSHSAGLLLVTRLLEAVTGWLGTLIIARELAPSAFGGYSFVFGLLGIIGLAVDLQVSRVALRDVLDAGDDPGSVVGSYVVFRTLIGAVAYTLALTVVLAGGYETKVVIGVVVAGLQFLFVAPNIGLQIWFRARRWMRPTAIGTAIGRLVQFALVVILAADGSQNLVLYAAAATAGELLIFLIRIWNSHLHGLRVSLTINTARWRSWLRESLPLAIGFSLVSVYTKLDLVLLSQLDSLRSVGQYTIGYKFADLASFVPFALMTPVMTLMVEAWPDRIVAIRRQFRQSLVLLTLAAVAGSVAFALVAGHAVVLLYGDRYAPAVDAARLLVAGAAVQFISYLCFVTLASIGRTMAYAIAGCVGLLVNVLLNVALIPPYSFDGSAIATVATELGVVAFLLAVLARTTTLVDVPWRAILNAVGAGAAMAGVYLGLELAVPWYVAIAGGLLAFLGTVHLLGADAPGGLPALLRAARFADEADELGAP